MLFCTDDSDLVEYLAFKWVYRLRPVVKSPTLFTDLLALVFLVSLLIFLAVPRYIPKVYKQLGYKFPCYVVNRELTLEGLRFLKHITKY